MDASTPAGEPFVHHVAVALSRALNSISVNELLARRVIDIARTNATVASFKRAIAAFGKFSEELVEELHTEILVHLSQEEKKGRLAVAGFAVHDEDGPDMLETEEQRAGGLVRGAAVRIPLLVWRSLVALGADLLCHLALQQHRYHAPQASLLGLDRLAAQKKAEAAAKRRLEEEGRSSSKKAKLAVEQDVDTGEAPMFKGALGSL